MSNVEGPRSVRVGRTSHHAGILPSHPSGLLAPACREVGLGASRERTSTLPPPKAGMNDDYSDNQHGCFSKQCTSEMNRTLQTSTVYFSRASYLFECNASDTYVLRMTHMSGTGAVDDRAESTQSASSAPGQMRLSEGARCTHQYI